MATYTPYLFDQVRSVPQNNETNIQEHFHHVAPIVQVRPIALGPTSQRIVCSSCHATIFTEVRYETTFKTHVMALLLCCLFFPAVCAPYCINSCNNTNHYCSHCGSYIGTYS